MDEIAKEYDVIVLGTGKFGSLTHYSSIWIAACRRRSAPSFVPCWLDVVWLT